MSLPQYNFDLCITPNIKTPPVLNLSQYDNTRTYTAYLKKDNGDPFYLNDGATAILEGVTDKSEVFQIIATIGQQRNTITFTPDSLATSTAGRVYTTLQIKNGDKQFAPIHIILNVQAAGASNAQKVHNQTFKDAVEEAFQDYISTHDSEGAVIPHADVTGDCAVIIVTSNGCNYNNSSITGGGITELVGQGSAVFAFYNGMMFSYDKQIVENGTTYQSFTHIEDGLLQQILVPLDSNTIQYRQTRIDGLLSTSGKNLVDSYNAVEKSSGTRINVDSNGEKATLFYRPDNEEQTNIINNKTGLPTNYALTSFRIRLAAPLLEGHTYVMSFDCEDLYKKTGDVSVLNNEYFPSFIIYNNTREWSLPGIDADGYELDDVVYDCNIYEKVYRSKIANNKAVLSDSSSWELIADKTTQLNQQNYVEALAICEPFKLHEGRMSIILTPQATIEEFIRFKEILGSGDHSRFVYTGEGEPSDPDLFKKIQINLFDIQIEEGTIPSNYQPAALATFERAKEAAELTHTYIEQASRSGWSVAELEGNFVIASYLLYAKNIQFLKKTAKNNYLTEYGTIATNIEGTNMDSRAPFHTTKRIYVPLPAPCGAAKLVGTTDYDGITIGEVTGYGNGAVVGASFRLNSTRHNDDVMLSRVTVRLLLNEKLATPREKPGIEYNEEIGTAIRDCARTYVTAQKNGRKFAYGSNITYVEREDSPRASNGLINDEYGNARMECDTFAGLVLRGIPYNKSPYDPTCTFYGDYRVSGLTYETYARPENNTGWYTYTGEITSNDNQDLGTAPSLANEVKIIQKNNDYYIYCPDYDPNIVIAGTNNAPTSAQTDEVLPWEKWSWKFFNYSRNGREYYLPLLHGRWLKNNASLVTRLKALDGESYRTGYQILMDISDAWTGNDALPNWAVKLREKISHETPNNMFGRDIKYASDYAWMFWWMAPYKNYYSYKWEKLESKPAYPDIDDTFNTLEDLKKCQNVYKNGTIIKVGTADPYDYYVCESTVNSSIKNLIFTDVSEVRPGDVVLFRKTDTGRWFHNISHVAIVTEAADVDGYITIAEVTGKAESGGRVLQEINMRYRDYTVAYFARPYGWYDSDESSTSSDDSDGLPGQENTLSGGLRLMARGVQPTQPQEEQEGRDIEFIMEE